jgi:hypothetical protein
MKGADALRLEVIPPLSRAAAWIEVLAPSSRRKPAPPCRCAGSEVPAGRRVIRKGFPVPAAYEASPRS